MTTRAQIDQELIAVAKAVLHKGTLRAKQSLFEQGLTSVGALEIRARVEKRFQVSLQSSVLFDYPSLAAFATFLEERLRLGSAKSMAAAIAVPPSGVESVDDTMVREILRKAFKV